MKKLALAAAFEEHVALAGIGADRQHEVGEFGQVVILLDDQDRTAAHFGADGDQRWYLTEDTGTGFVHTAPGHGREDFEACSFINVLLEFGDLEHPVGRASADYLENIREIERRIQKSAGRERTPCLCGSSFSFRRFIGE